MLPCTKSLDISFEQPVNELRVKERYNVTAEGIQRDQIDEQSCTINIAGIVTDDYENLDTIVDILQSKSEVDIELRYKDEPGAKNIKFIGLINAYSDADESLIEFTGSIQSTGVVNKGNVVTPPLFTFTTNKIGEIDISTDRFNTFQDGNGNPLTMPYNRIEGDSDTILMYGSALNTITTLTAPNNQLIGAYDFSSWTALNNANLEGNAFDSLIFVDSQFNTGTLNVINSIAEGEAFSTFIQSFDSVMVTARSSNIEIGTINDPAMLEAGTPEYNAIQSLIAKSWNVTVTANVLLTATISGTKVITPTATFNGVGSVLYQLNGVTVSSVSNTNSDANSFTVYDGDSLTCWYANNTNDIVGLNTVVCNDCSIQYIYLEQLINESTVTLEVKRNVYTTQSINIIKSYLDLDVSNGDDYTSEMIVNINSLQIGDLYTDYEYVDNIIRYTHFDRLKCYTAKIELTYIELEEDHEDYFYIPTIQIGSFSYVNNSLTNESKFYLPIEPNILENFDADNNVNLNKISFYNDDITNVNTLFRSRNSGLSGNQEWSNVRFTVNNFLVQENNINNAPITNDSIITGSFLINGNDLTGYQDWSRCLFNTFNFNVSGNTSMTNFSMKNGSTLTVNFYMSNTGVTGVLDLSSVTFNTSDFRTLNNSSMNSIILGNSSSLTGSIRIEQSGLSGTLDWSNITSINVNTFLAFTCPNLNDINFPSNCTISNNFEIYDCNLNSVLNWGNLVLNTSVFDIRGNSNINEIILNNSSTLTSNNVLYDQTNLLIRKQDGTIILQVP